MKSTFLILLALSFFCSQGQPVVHPWYSKMTNKIDFIQKSEFDSVFSYISVDYSADSWGEEVKGLGKILKQGEAILVGFKNNRISCIKIIEDFHSIFRSKPIDLKLDSILQNLREHAAEIQAEIVLPYVCEIYSDSVSTIKGFYTVESRLHIPFCCLYFKCATKFSVNEFEFESLNEKYEKADKYPPNLNAKYNASLKSYKLHSFLIGLLTKYENQFDFRK